MITGFSLLNKNLGNAVKLFSLINETPGISSRSSAQILSEESGNAGGFNGTGNPDPKDIDPELLRLNDLYTRLTTLMDIELDKGIIFSDLQKYLLPSTPKQPWHGKELIT